jgi:nucleotide-binding universal stress UspA family protein
MSVRTIVVGVDPSENGQRAVRFAATLAAQLGARVVAVHAFEPLALLGTVAPPVDFAALEEDARSRLAGEWTRPLAEAGVAHACVLVENRPVPALVDAVRDHAADLVVVGARGRSPVRQLVLGSTSLKLPHEVAVPVTIVP